VDEATMREFYALCLTSAAPPAPEEMPAVREREQIPPSRPEGDSLIVTAGPAHDQPRR
jgi:hypothetical protein